MKKSILSITAIFATLLLNAQGISLSPKVVNGWGPNAGDRSPSLTIRNNTTDATDNEFTWSVLSLSKPTGWKVDFCDPSSCIPDVTQGTAYDFLIEKDAVGIMKSDFYFNNAAGQGSLTVVVKSKKNPSNADTAVFNATAWITSVNEASKAKTIAFYPNPVKDELTLKFPTKEAVSVDIFNVLGMKVKSFNHSVSSTTIQVGDLQNGVYFIRFTENGKSYTKQFTKTN